MEDDGLRRYQQQPVHLDDDEKKALAKLRIEIAAIKNLKCPLNDEFLIRFLRTKKNDVQRTVEMIDRYFKTILELQHVYDVTYVTCKSIHETKSMVVFKKRDEKGRIIFYINLSLMDLEHLTQDEMKVAFYLILEEISNIDEFSKNGCYFIIDKKGMKFSQVKRWASFFTFKEIKMSMKWYQIWSSTGTDILKNNFNPNVLPVSLGGTVPDEEAADIELQKRALINYQFFQDTRKYGYTI